MTPKKATPKAKEKVGKFLGMPMRWEFKNTFGNVWNPKDDRVFPPKYFGVGWDINVRALLKKIHLIK
jgi:hypothetical protein